MVASDARPAAELGALLETQGRPEQALGYYARAAAKPSSPSGPKSARCRARSMQRIDVRFLTAIVGLVAAVAGTAAPREGPAPSGLMCDLLAMPERAEIASSLEGRYPVVEAVGSGTHSIAIP